MAKGPSIPTARNPLIAGLVFRRTLGDSLAMSVAELKQAVEVLSEAERLELAEYLRWRSRNDDPQWQAEIGNRLNRCLAGQGVSGAEFQALHEKLYVGAEMRKRLMPIRALGGNLTENERNSIEPA